MRRASWLGLFLYTSAVLPAAAQQSMGTQQSSLSANQSIISASAEPIAGEPYRADKITRSTWTLSDGTTIAHETTGMIARDADGRMREDIYLTHSGNMNGRQMDLSLQSATVADPVEHTMLIWTGNASKIATQMQLPFIPKPASLAAPPPGPPHSPADNRMPNLGTPASVRIAEAAATMPPGVPTMIKDNAPSPGGLRMSGPKPKNINLGNPSGPSDDVRTEDLGQQFMEGVLVTGKRVTTTIPIGKVGNDRPMVVVHEEWRSPELKILLKMIDTDPRTGQQTMELKNLVRGDPDETLFHAPEGYQVRDMGDIMKGLGDTGRPKAP